MSWLSACPPAAPGGVTEPNLGTKRDGGHSAPDYSSMSGDCGAIRQSCCEDEQCKTGLQCNTKGGCCAPASATCSDAKDCCNGLSCTDKKCCGSTGTSCNKPNDCCTGMACEKGACVKSSSSGSSGGTCDGSLNKPCCTMKDSQCNSGLACVSGTCKTCGASGQPCCDNNTCSQGNTCNTSASKCALTCGDEGDPCCKGNNPCDKSPGLSCDSSTNKCTASPGSTKGGVNQPCDNGKCNTSLICAGGNCQKPSTSNTAGAVCTNGACSGGYVCDSTSNKCVKIGTMQLPIQSLCSGQTDCNSGLQCILTRQPGDDFKNAKSCCVGADTACDGDFDCCGLLLCGDDDTCTAGEIDAECITNADCDSQFCGPDGFCSSASSAPDCVGVADILWKCNAQTTCCGGSTCLPVHGSPWPTNCCYLSGHQCRNNLINGDMQCCGRMACDSTLNVCVCTQPGQDCDIPEECCDYDQGAVCNAGKCFVPGVTPVSPGQLCSSEHCIDAHGSSYSCSRDLGGGTLACCTETFQTHCSSANECCAPLICDDNGFFNLNGGSKVCCAPAGQACEVDDDCCGHNSCKNKTCG